MEFEDVIRKRESTRKFSDKAVDTNILNKILEAGRLAPTAKNIQPFKIYVVKTKEGLEKIDKASRCRYNAPIVLLICGNKEEAFKDEFGSTYETDASIVTTHMMLEATNLGVDNIWIRLFDEKVLREEFNISNEFIPVALLPIGYRTDDCPNSPRHNIRKDIEELVEYC
ncbi:MAG: nitroreductase family protein [Bacilli bacterium]|nr:nitroreductase family protein [Bacilli bacterium]